MQVGVGLTGLLTHCDKLAQREHNRFLALSHLSQYLYDMQTTKMPMTTRSMAAKATEQGKARVMDCAESVHSDKSDLSAGVPE